MIQKLIYDTVTGPSGKTSTIRMAALWICGIVMSVWAYISISKLEMQPISDEVLILVLGSLGAKVAQMVQEKKPKPDQKSPT